MPRKAKELIEEVKKELKLPTRTVSQKKSSTSKATVEKNKTAKKKTAKKTTVKVNAASEKKVIASKNTKTTIAKKKPIKKEAKVTKKTTRKKSTTVSKKVTSKSTSSSKKKTINQNSEPINMLEYYDLPYRYNQTVVKILAQTPKMLFVYWDISEKDRQNYISQYGENFFNNTIPFLRVRNENKHYTFEVEVDDFANSWYLPIHDAKCVYTIELFRKQKPQTLPVIQKDLYITSSNKLEVPNDHILFERQQKMVYFKNVKTNQVSHKNVATLAFIKNMGKIYNIYDLYKQIYHDEELNILSNPSSNPSSDFMINNLN